MFKKMVLSFVGLVLLASAGLINAQEQPNWHDIDYVGDGIIGHRLDIYLPDTDSDPYPVVVYIYGSAFFDNDGKGNFKHGFAPVLLEAGFAVAAINHRGTETDDVIFPALVHDVKAAIRFIRANASSYNLDPTRIGATGCSSGGHLVAFLGTSGGVKTHTVGDVTMNIEGSLGAHTDVSSSVRAVCDWFGPTDFLVMDSCGSKMNHDAHDSPESVLIGGPIQEHRDECELANPATYIDSDDPPFMIIHGDKDPLVPHCNSESLDAALDKAGVSSDYILVEGAGHGEGLIEPLYLGKMVQFFKKHLKNKQVVAENKGAQGEDKAYKDFYKRVQDDEPYNGFFAAEKKCIKKVDEAYKKARRRFFLGVSVSDEEVGQYMEQFIEFCKEEDYLVDGCEEQWQKTLTILSFVLYANKPIFEFTADNIIEHRNLVFAEYPNKKLALDLFLPEEPLDKPVPCIVCIHGGAWMVNRRIWFEPFAKYLASKGFAAVARDYRMLPAVKVIDCVYDCKAAVRWVRANAEKYGIDPDRIGAIGASAGAHLIALLATTANVPELEGSVGNAGISSAVQAAVGFATPAFKIEGAGSAKAKRFGFTEEEIKLLSPYEHISSSAAPLYLVHGTKDRVVNPQDSQDLYDKYKEVGAHAELKWVPDKGHGFYEGTDLGIALATEFFKKQFGQGGD